MFSRLPSSSICLFHAVCHSSPGGSPADRVQLGGWSSLDRWGRLPGRGWERTQTWQGTGSGGLSTTDLKRYQVARSAQHCFGEGMSSLLCVFHCFSTSCLLCSFGCAGRSSHKWMRKENRHEQTQNGMTTWAFNRDGRDIMEVATRIVAHSSSKPDSNRHEQVRVKNIGYIG